MSGMSTMNRKVQVVFAAAILAMFVVGGISYRGIVLSNRSDWWVRHTREVLEHLGDLLSAMQSVESGYQGFALTGDESSVISYHAGILRSEQAETIIRNLTVDNATQQHQFPALDQLASQNIEFGKTVIALRRAKGLEVSARAIRD